MFQHDLRHTGRAQHQVPNSPTLLWQRSLARMPGSPAIGADGTVYLPAGVFQREDNGFLYAINPNGTVKWRHFLRGLPGNTAPAVDANGTIYVHATTKQFGVGGGHERLYAINPNGSRKWTFTLSSESLNGSDVHSSPVIADDGTIYVGSWGGNLYAINPNGTLKWADSPDGSSIFSSPALGGDGTIYFVTAGFDLWAYNPTGTEKWHAHLSNLSGGLGSPSVAASGTVYVSSQSGLHAVSAAGLVKWTRAAPGDGLGRAIGADGTVYAAGKALFAYSPAGGFKWRFGELGALGAPVVGSNGTIVWRQGFEVFGVNPNGTRRWGLRITSPEGDATPPAIGANRTLYVPVPSARTLRAYGE